MKDEMMARFGLTLEQVDKTIEMCGEELVRTALRRTKHDNPKIFKMNLDMLRKHPL